ncbi:hypothetical protein Pryu01_01263 [Paraliobacillus ryukyuensis]|uniref:DNA-binding XRE family transcriptional regulator n=1 Tax=Paraliobacillus ryukyuensis TaxID=200904 RepID=A0A366EAU6_9BACI|nr:helix-turn-helix transcriptional regulator [Paraliobacillus ryukyuensis]RBO99503.1 DNA-binding XRE family transcriptional regulator [Paraliobacillus ryukyuensis]
MGISENLKLLRDRYDLTQQELGEIAGVSDKAVSTWEKGEKTPRMGAIQKIADHFNIKKSQLIEDSGLDRVKEDKGQYTIAAHHDGEDWSEDELEEIKRFKEYLRSKRDNN